MADARRERRVESLGWLTESTIMPKKQRVIEGVSASSIVQLKAELYETQEDLRRRQEGDASVPKHRVTKKIDPFERRNAGVDGREQRDKLVFKELNDGTASYGALEKKAELYEKLLKGELPDEEEKEKYSVDFLRKGYLEDERVEMEQEKRGARQNSEKNSDEEEASTSWGSKMNEIHKLLVKEVNKETVEAREKAVQLRQRRLQAADKHREKLKQAFLKKQIDKLKQAAVEKSQEVSVQEQDQSNAGDAKL